MGAGHYTGTSKWRRVRLTILERDNHLCQVRGPRCTIFATAVDHIVPVDDGGELYDPDNLRAICTSCNNWRAQRNKHQQGWRRSPTRIILVMGPPAAGKSTFIRERQGPHDVVIDYDAMAAAMGAPTHDLVNAARNVLLKRVRRGDVQADRVWIHSANPRAAGIFPFHELVVLDPGKETVKARALETREPGCQALIDAWYEAREAPMPTGLREW